MGTGEDHVGEEIWCSPDDRHGDGEDASGEETDVEEGPNG